MGGSCRFYDRELTVVVVVAERRRFCLQEGNIQMSSFHGHESVASSSVLPPQWVDDVDGVNDALADIQRLMDVLQSLHASRVGSVFGRDLDDMEGKIEKLTRDITGMAHAEQKMLMAYNDTSNRVRCSLLVLPFFFRPLSTCREIASTCRWSDATSGRRRGYNWSQHSKKVGCNPVMFDWESKGAKLTSSVK